MSTEQTFRLGDGEVHVWIASVDDERPDLHEGLLSEEETAKASRLRRLADRQRYVGAHGLLRTLLGGYLDERPETLQFRHGARGKPELARGDEQASVSFNLAHSGRLVAVAVSRSLPVGIDIERVDSALDTDGVARIALSDLERAALGRMALADRPRGLCAAWVCKEAVLKATGRGLVHGTREVQVPAEVFLGCAGGAPASFDFVTECEGPWRVRGFGLDDHYFGAVAAPIAGWRLCRFGIEALSHGASFS